MYIELSNFMRKYDCVYVRNGTENPGAIKFVRPKENEGGNRTFL